MILFEEFEKLRLELIEAYDRKGMRASGKWAEALEVIQGENSVKLMGLDYSQQLETGRRANNGSSGKDWKTAKLDIEQWIDDKGIMAKVEGNITKSSLAFLIARKIARQGWNRAEFGGVELISEVITKERINDIVQKAGQQYSNQFISEILVLLTDDTIFNTVS
jgi:hypothetical protein